MTQDIWKRDGAECAARDRKEINITADDKRARIFVLIMQLVESGGGFSACKRKKKKSFKLLWYDDFKVRMWLSYVLFIGQRLHERQRRHLSH